MNMLQMLKPARFFKLAGADAKNAVRDPVLLYVIILSILPVLIIFFWRRQIETAVGRSEEHTSELSHTDISRMPSSA